MTRRSPLSFLLFLSLGLFLRTLVPTGWMPAAEAGPFAIEPCPAAGLAIAMVHDSAMHHGTGHHQAGHDSDCAFAPFDSAAAPANVPVALLSAVPPTPPPYQEAAVTSFATGPPALPPPATGPPALT